MEANELPDKYQTCDWLWNYGSIGLTKEHIKRLNNAINILESLNEYTDAKYLKEIKSKLLEDIPEIKSEKTNTDVFIEKALKWYCLDCACNDNCKGKCAFWSFFKDYLEDRKSVV